VVDAAPPASVIAPAPVLAHAVVTLVAGTSEIRGESGVVEAGEGVTLAQGDVLTTSEASSLHARLGAGLGIALEPSTELRIASLDGAPELALAHGRLATHIGDSRTIVLAGQFRIEAQVASFVIDFDAERAALTVDVREGEVHVTGPGVDERITGPGRFPSEAPALEAASPIGVDEPYDALPSVHASREGIVRWEIGDVGAVGADHIAMRVGVGPTTIRGWDARGRMFRATVTVGAEGLDLSPDDLEPEAPRIHQGVLAREDIVPVVHQHMRDLQRCYEHELRTTPTLSVHVVARVSVEMTGSVADEVVAYSGDAVPPAMARCMTNQIQTWIFPAPDGGAVTVPLPFAFDPR